MRPLIFFYFAMAAASFYGCTSKMKLYKENQIEIISKKEQPAGSIEVVFKVPLESLYYCPGARVQEESSLTRVYLIRCGIKEKCMADLPAIDIGSEKSRIEIKGKSARLVFVFEDGERVIHGGDL